MQKRQDVILNTRGEPISGVSVRVVTFPVAADATIYSDDGITQTTNPLTTDANGRFSYYAADGRYSEQLSGAGITPLTVTDILLQDAVAATIPESLFHNLSLQFSVAGGALTIAMKTTAGANPSTASPVRIVFRSQSATLASHTSRSITAVNQLTVTSGSTLGVLVKGGGPGSLPCRVWIVAFDDGGVISLGVINCLNMAPTAGPSIFQLASLAVASSTAEGGAGAADSAHVFYTSAAITSKPYAILGYAVWDAGLTAPGTWSAPTQAELFGPQMPLPGTLIQHRIFSSAEFATGTTTIPSDDTVPQNTEGDQYMTLALSPNSPANVGVIDALINLSSSIATTVTSALFINTAASAVHAVASSSDAAGRLFKQRIHHSDILQDTSPITAKVRSGGAGAGTTTANGVAGARLYGSVYQSVLEFREFMA